MELLENKKNAGSDKNEVRFTEEDHLEMEGKSNKKNFRKTNYSFHLYRHRSLLE